MNEVASNTVDCKLHERIAHQAILEWTLAMAPLQFPPYVVEHIFNALKLNSTHENYQQRKGIDFLWIPTDQSSKRTNSNFVHLILEERTHQANIKLFISVHKAFQQKVK